jgi:hypothetical protein
MLEICGELMCEYGGSLKKLHREAKDSRDFESRVARFLRNRACHCNIFLREMRPYWEKADPEPLPVVRDVTRMLKADLESYDRKSLDFARFEAGLMRMRKNVHRA